MNNEHTQSIGCLFNIIHSLPASSHSVGLAGKSPAMAFDHSSMYFPDYGGLLELPNLTLKNYALGRGFAFYRKPIFGKLTPTSYRLKGRSQAPDDGLVVTSYLWNDDNRQYSVIRALGSSIYLDSVTETPSETCIEVSSKQYGRINMEEQISGIKYCPSVPDTLLLGCRRVASIIKLNQSFEVDRETNMAEDPTDQDKTPFHELSSIDSEMNSSIKDACINPNNPNIQTIASEERNSRMLKIYDISKDTKSPFQVFHWLTEDDDALAHLEEDKGSSSTGRRKLTFKLAKKINHGIQQIDNIPTHLVNMLVTTDYRTFLFDPRQKRPTSNYVDKSKLDSFLPIEFLRKHQFSLRNSNQFYSLSNVGVRVFDFRYPGMAVNQLSHMLDSESHGDLNLRVVGLFDSLSETLCISASGRLCFMTFDQSQESYLINPRSEHMPYHENFVNERSTDAQEKLVGLDVVPNKITDDPTGEMFSVFQMYDTGALCIRRYMSPSLRQDEAELDAQVLLLNENELLEDMTSNSYSKIPEESDLLPRDVLEDVREEVQDDSIQLNILDSSSMMDLNVEFESQRAVERYRKMISRI